MYTAFAGDTSIDSPLLKDELELAEVFVCLVAGRLRCDGSSLSLQGEVGPQDALASVLEYYGWVSDSCHKPQFATSRATLTRGRESVSDNQFSSTTARLCCF